MEVLSASLTNNAWISTVFTFCYAVGYFAIEAAEDRGATGVMKARKITVGEDDGGYFDSVARNKLDDAWWKSSLEEDFVNYVIGSDC